MASALQTRSSFIFNCNMKEVGTARTQLEHLNVIKSCRPWRREDVRFISPHHKARNIHNQSIYNPSDASNKEPGGISISTSAKDGNGNWNGPCSILVFHCLWSCSLLTESTTVDAGAKTGVLGEGESRGDQQSIDPLWPAAAPKGPQIYLAKWIQKAHVITFFTSFIFF